MRKLITILLIVIFSSCNNESAVVEQGCDNGTFVGNVQLTTQQEVEDWGVMCYSKIEGALFIGGGSNDISDFSSLLNLKEVENRFHIEGIETINLIGLEGLTKVGGLTIKICPNLMNLEGLNNLETIGDLDNNFAVDFENIRLIDNPALETLQGLENLKYVNGILIAGNGSLANLDGLESLELVSGLNPDWATQDIEIGQFQLSGLPFGANSSLRDFCALQNLFINGNYNPDRILMRNEDFSSLNNVFEVSVQQIIDGDCMF